MWNFNDWPFLRLVTTYCNLYSSNKVAIDRDTLKPYNVVLVPVTHILYLRVKQPHSIQNLLFFFIFADLLLKSLFL